MTDQHSDRPDPAGGSYPPGPGVPPPAGYYPPGGYYAPPQPFLARVDLGDAARFSWRVFARRWPVLVGAWGVQLGAVLVLVVAFFVAYFAFIVGLAATSSHGRWEGPLRGGEVAALVSGGVIVALFVLAVGVFSLLFQAMASRAVLAMVDGRPVSFGEFFRLKGLGPAVWTAVLVTLMVAVGSVLCVLPGLVAAWFLQFAVIAAVDRREGVGAAISSSCRLVRDHLGPTVLLMVLGAVVSGVAGSVALVGMLIAGPLVMIATVYAYRRLQDQPVVMP